VRFLTTRRLLSSRFVRTRPGQGKDDRSKGRATRGWPRAPRTVPGTGYHADPYCTNQRAYILWANFHSPLRWMLTFLWANFHSPPTDQGAMQSARTRAGKAQNNYARTKSALNHVFIRCKITSL